MTVTTELREERKEARRRRLLEAALKTFAEIGYYDTSVDMIVSEAHTSKTTFYEFFESKEDCVRDILAREGGELTYRVVTEAAQGTDHRERMRRGIRAFVMACAERRQLARVLLFESVGVSPEIEAVRHTLHGKFAHVVAEEVRRAQGSDDFYAAVDPEIFGRAVVGAVNEATGASLSQPDSDPEQLAAGLCAIFAP